MIIFWGFFDFRNYKFATNCSIKNYSKIYIMERYSALYEKWIYLILMVLFLKLTTFNNCN